MTSRQSSIEATLQVLLTPGKGLIAPDEHPDRLARALGIDHADPLTRSRHRAMVLETPHLNRWISAAVIDAEALLAGTLSIDPDGPALGVRLGSDTDHYQYGEALSRRVGQMGAQLSMLRDRGVAFAKWRADLDPTTATASAYVDTRYLAACAAMTLEADMAPVLDVAMPNQRTHSLAVAIAVSANALNSLFVALTDHDVDPAHVLVRMNMVRAGIWHEDQTSPAQAGRSTLRVLAGGLPDEAPGVMFMSTGMSSAEACADLAAISMEADRSGWHRPMTFGFGRALLERGTRAWVRDGEVAAQTLIAEDCAAAAAAAAGRLIGA